jgi:biopolymer transport protein ExbB
MNRPPRLLVLAVVALTAVLKAASPAAEGAPPAPALVAKADQARHQAEDQLASERARISGERAELAKSLLAADQLAEQLRDQLRRAQLARDAAQAELARLSQERAHEQEGFRLLLDRALLAARLAVVQAAQSATAGWAEERATAAAAGIHARLEALPGLLALHTADERVVTRSGALDQVPVLRLGAARAVALGPDDARRGLLMPTADGSLWMIAGPLLPALEGGGRVFPLDADNTIVHQQPQQARSVAAWIRGGRFFIWPIMAVGALGLALCLERLAALWRLRIDVHQIVRVGAALAEQDGAGALSVVARRRTPLERVLYAGIEALARPREAREAVLDQTLLAEAPRLQRGLAFILVMAGISPLLGLLGTVTGMIDMFGVIAQQGSGNAKSLSGAISEALITTQAGMLVAIPLLLLHAVIARTCERRLVLLEEAACGLLGIDQTERSAASPDGAQPRAGTALQVQP